MPQPRYLRQRLSATPRGDWCNSVRTNLFEATYMLTEIRPYSRHRRNCDFPSQGWRGRAYKEVFAASYRIACAKSAPQVIGCCLTTLFAPTAVGDTEGEIGATLSALSSLKHLKCLQKCSSFSGSGSSSGGTVTVEKREECKHPVNSVVKTTQIRVLLPLSKT